ncbi:MAG: alkaline phosphatase family protein [Rhodoluna sp.]|nr:alkaline phosphatase family protein [Rhodoluna sp.]MBP6186214.1 alkaline phosphatase family protein [Rhodoluna sp.]
MTSMLPAIPPAFGNLKDVFRSAQRSVLGLDNAFNLPAVGSAIVIMVDGLGVENLTAEAKSAPFLSSAPRETIYSGFPSTTASSIVSFASGVSNSEHGLFGYKIYDRSREAGVNLLSGIDKYSVLDYLKVEPISSEEPGQVHAVTLREYSDSGFTRATMHLAEHHFADSIAGRFEIAATLANSHDALIYVYVPELDQAAHRHGVASAEWRNLLSDLDIEISKLSKILKDNTGLLITSDHGIVDVASENHVFLDEFMQLRDQLLDVAGDPRVAFLYLRESNKLQSIKEFLRSQLADRALVVQPGELIAASYWQETILQDEDLLPDLVVIAESSVAIYHRDFAKANSLKMVGQHGALSSAEIRLPLIGLGAYSSSLLVP